MKRILFAGYALLFLFYPGDIGYYSTLAYHRDFFARPAKSQQYKIHLVPALKNPYYPQISAEGVYIADLTSFTPLYEKNATQRFYPASTAKILTALVGYDLYKPDDIITVTKVLEDGQTMGLVAGERITAENLLYGILVHSGNDAAYALAESVGQERFVTLMNKKAEDLYMRTTHVQNPAGLDASNQYTTPSDLALAARELLKNPYLAKIVSTKEIVISDVDFKYFHDLKNVNKLLGEIQGIGGLKTGYTENAGENLVSFYKRRDGHELIIIVLKSTDRFQDTETIINWIETNIEYININF